MLVLKDDEIGGAIVRRTFMINGAYVLPQTDLTREQVLAIPTNNRNALCRAEKLAVYPRRRESKPVEDGAPRERHAYHLGRGQWEVIEGVRIGTALSREQAEALIAELDPPAADTAH